MAWDLRSSLFPDVSRSSASSLPELRDAEYQDKVLRLSAETLDTHLDKLIIKAETLGITCSRSPSADSIPDNQNVLSPESNVAADTTNAQAVLPGSRQSANAGPASPSLNNSYYHTGSILIRRRSRALTFAQYENYLSHLQPHLGQSGSLASSVVGLSPSFLSLSTSKGYRIIRNNLSKIRGRRKTVMCSVPKLISCISCREDLQPNQQLQKLPCGHSYCSACLRTMINQATTDESLMPPRCCTQPIPSPIIKTILSREDQTKFLKAVFQFSTPWESRVFCSNSQCGEFIPPRPKPDPKHPFKVICRKCRTRVCVMCKRDAHPIGQDCPNDLELDAVLKIGETAGWRRCYKCRTLVELSYGCTHMTCRCRAQFCYICGAVWDPVVGCPKFCNGDDEMERRRLEEQARLAALEAETAKKELEAEMEAAQEREAEQRTRDCHEFKALRTEQSEEMERFGRFEEESRWLLWTRHAVQKNSLNGKHSAAVEKMLERHAKTSANLEDRQVAAEMEFRDILKQSEKHVRIRLKHMEAYCEGLGHSPGTPPRVVTERNLRELGQQYNLEKNMKQLHQAKINVLRDRQAKALEGLLERQGNELARLVERNNKEVEQLELGFADEEETLVTIFSARQSILESRWKLEMEIMRKELENKQGVSYKPLPPLEWPQSEEILDHRLGVVMGL